MCRLKSYSLSQKCVWRLVCFTGCVLLVLGAASFGFGMKLIEFAEKTDVTPVFAGIPMMLAGFLGLASGLCKKGWLVTGYGICCVIISMLSIHMNYRFMGKELPSIPIYRDQCMNEPKVQNHCDRYIGTVALCSTAVLMLPFILAAILSCVAAKRILKKKSCCIFWLTCSKVEPSLPIYDVKLHRYKNRQKTNPVGLISYKNNTSKGFVFEIPETRPTAEYLPKIPDFTDLAGRPDSPGYPASVLFEYENKNFGASGECRKNKYGHSITKEQSLSLIASDVTTEDDARTAHVQRKRRSNSVPQGVATSEIDLSLLEQDYLNRRSYLEEEENEKYYSFAAEEWIQKMVENVHDSRSRLYAVSDEEDLNEAPRRKESSERTDKHWCQSSIESENQEELSSSTGSPPQQQFSDVDGNVDNRSARKMSLKTESCINSSPRTTVERELSSEPDKNYIDKGKLYRDHNKLSVLVPRRRKLGASSPCDIEQEKNYSQSESSTTDSQSDTSITDIQSESSANSQSRSLGNDKSGKVAEEVSIEYFGSKDSTPLGIVTPIGQPFPSGSLYFEFEKAAPIKHAPKNWVEFEGQPEGKERLLKGKMTLKEYEELTSYLM